MESVRDLARYPELRFLNRWDVLPPVAAALSMLVLGWWLGVLVYLVPRRSELRVAGADTPGAVVAAISAFALVVAALWLQHCCRSPGEPTENGEPAPE